MNVHKICVDSELGNAVDSPPPAAVQPFVRLAHFALDSARSPMTSRLCNVNVYVPTPRACHHVPQPRTLALWIIYLRQHFRTPVDELSNDLGTHLRRLISSCLEWHCCPISVRSILIFHGIRDVLWWRNLATCLKQRHDRRYIMRLATT